MTDLPVLKPGDIGESVSRLKGMLTSQGCFVSPVNIGSLTYNAEVLDAVLYFQATHLDSSGKFLEADGVVGPKTWWALQNPSGNPQRSHLISHVPAGIAGARADLIRVAFQEHAAGIHEVPDGSNCGDGVDKFIKGFGPVPWCALSLSWIFNAALGHYLMNTRYALVLKMWRDAIDANKAHYKSSYEPVPGDVMVMLYKDANGHLTGTGHTGLVVAVGADGRTFNTAAGNEGNRFKLGTRTVDETAVVGFINPFGDEGKVHYTKGLLSSVGGALASTR